MGFLEKLFGPASPERRRAAEERMIVGIFALAVGAPVMIPLQSMS